VLVLPNIVLHPQALTIEAPAAGAACSAALIAASGVPPKQTDLLFEAYSALAG